MAVSDTEQSGDFNPVPFPATAAEAVLKAAPVSPPTFTTAAITATAAATAAASVSFFATGAAAATTAAAERDAPAAPASPATAAAAATASACLSKPPQVWPDNAAGRLFSTEAARSAQPLAAICSAPPAAAAAAAAIRPAAYVTAKAGLVWATARTESAAAGSPS